MSRLPETERLRLRKFEPEDLDFLAKLLDDAEAMRFYPRRLNRDEARAWLDRNLARYARDGHGFWLAIEKSSGRPAGQIGLIEQEKDGQRFTEVGYMLARDAWGKGLATEAARACLAYGFHVLGRERLHAMIRPENTPSERVAERLGMQPGRSLLHANLLHRLWSIDRAAYERMAI